MIGRLSFVLPALLLVFASCKQEQKPATTAPAKAAGPAIRATVLTIQSKMGDAPTATHEVIIANGRARSTEELDAWRLFDTKSNEVTFVDDLAKTYTTVPFKTLLANRTAANERPLDPDLQRAQVLSLGKTQQLQGVASAETIIRLGSYERHLWIGTPNGVPPTLFAMMQLSHPPTSSLAPVMRDVDTFLGNVKGFALAEETALPYGNKKLVAARNVTAIAQKDVAASLIEIPRGYEKVAYVAPALPAVTRRDVLPATLSPTTESAVAPPPIVAAPVAPKPAAVQPAAKPTAKPAVKPAAKPVVKPAAKPAKKSTVKPAPKRTTKPTVKRPPAKRATPKAKPKPPPKKRTPPKKRS